MSEVDTNPADPTEESMGAGGGFSFGRVLLIVVPVALVLAAVLGFSSSLPNHAQQQLESNQLQRLLGKAAEAPSEQIEFVDEDDDLIADPPPDDQCIDPVELKFAYVASDDPGKEAEIWRPFLDALADATGAQTKYVHYQSVNEQLDALATGDLHVTAVNTGAVPLAVRASGFVPVSTFGEEGRFGYTMQLLISPDSTLEELADFKGQRKYKITFVRPTSNSGFKAPLVLLMDHGILPERDYDYGFSMGHDSSVRELLDGKTDAAPVASDIFDRMVADGEVNRDSVRVLYESERFPPVALGYAHNLKPKLREAIEELLVEFEWSGTPLVDAYGTAGVTGFVPVDYKDDWANIRRIDDAIERARR